MQSLRLLRDHDTSNHRQLLAFAIEYLRRYGLFLVVLGVPVDCNLDMQQGRFVLAVAKHCIMRIMLQAENRAIGSLGSCH